jgi:regulator of RNase E activity RraB
MHEAELREANATVVRQLSQHRIRLEQEADIDHFVYFKSLAQATAFATAAAGKGWQVEDPRENHDETSVVVTLRHSLDLPTVNEQSIVVNALAEQMGGEYDGWAVGTEGLDTVDGCPASD